MGLFSKSDQERWDDQIEANRSSSWFGRGRVSHQIADRMEQCPNNPRNGGDGYDKDDGEWVDRRWGQ